MSTVVERGTEGQRGEITQRGKCKPTSDNSGRVDALVDQHLGFTQQLAAEHGHTGRSVSDGLILYPSNVDEDLRREEGRNVGET